MEIVRTAGGKVPANGLPEFHVTDDASVDFTKRPTMGAVCLLDCVPPLVRTQ